MSDTKTTVEMQAPPEWAINLTKKVVDGFASVDNRLDAVEANVSALVDDKRITNERLSRIENWKEKEVEKRLDANSERVKESSKVDLKHEAAIAAIKEEVEKLAARPDTGAQVLAAVTKLGQTTTGKRLLGAATPVLLLAITLLGLLLQAQITKLQAAPAPAPTVVYVPTPADGGAR